MSPFYEAWSLIVLVAILVVLTFIADYLGQIARHLRKHPNE